MVGLEGGGVKMGIPMLPMTPPPPPPLPPSPGELPKGEFPREGGTGDSEASGVKVCAESDAYVVQGSRYTAVDIELSSTDEACSYVSNQILYIQNLDLLHFSRSHISFNSQ